MAAKCKEAGWRQQTEVVARALRDRASQAGDRAPEPTARARGLARRARDESVDGVRALASRAHDSVRQAPAAVHSTRKLPVEPHLCLLVSPGRPIPPLIMSDSVRVATYNVHRGRGPNGRVGPDVARAECVGSETDADVMALQEVLRPFDPAGPTADHALGRLGDAFDLHVDPAARRCHGRGPLGNAIFSGHPITDALVLDIVDSRNAHIVDVCEQDSPATCKGVGPSSGRRKASGAERSFGVIGSAPGIPGRASSKGPASGAIGDAS